MTMITPFKSYTASLFGIPGKAAVQVKPVQIQQIAVPAVSRAPAGATISASGPYEPYKDPEFVRDPAAAIAKSEAAMAVWEAGEQRFEQENGFRRLVNSMALGSYAQAKSGNFGVPSFGTADEAAEYLEHLVSSMRTNTFFANYSVNHLERLARPEVAAAHDAAHGEVATAQKRAMHADEKLAMEMDLFVRNAVLTRAFGTSGALYAQDSTGRISFVAQDVTFEGKPLARLSADGFLTRLAPDGTPLTPPETPPAGIDRRI